MKKTMQILGLTAVAAMAHGIDCGTLAHWSGTDPSVNLHHIFCGEINGSGKAVGFHSIPNGDAPTTYVSHNGGEAENAAGIYVWKKIELTIGSNTVTKSMSSMFPNACSKDAVLASIVYSSKNNTGSCASVSWAVCGPSAPLTGDKSGYCLGDDGNRFTIGSAAVTVGNKVNTAFPIYIK